LCCAIIHGGGYRAQIRSFERGDYVYLQKTTLTILDVTIGCVILCVQKVLPFAMLLLEGRDGQRWKDRVCNCVPCHLLIVDGQMDPSLVLVLASL